MQVALTNHLMQNLMEEIVDMSCSIVLLWTYIFPMLLSNWCYIVKERFRVI